jgi:tRNA modification GTPase
MVEINLHGGKFLIQTVLNLLYREGVSPAKPGEFSQRACLNGKLTLAQAENINDLIYAKNELVLKKANWAMEEKYELPLKDLYEQIKALSSQYEVALEYPDLDVNLTSISEQVNHILAQLQHLKIQTERYLILKNGYQVAIIGAPNVGKSSLLNNLAKAEKALVSSYAGTTRDAIEVEITFDDLTINLIDTAGLHSSKKVLEQLGMQKTKEVITSADLILYLVDGTKEHPISNQIVKLLATKNYLTVLTKIDQLPLTIDQTSKYDVMLSNVTQEGITTLIEKIKTLANVAQVEANAFFLSNQRQLDLLLTAIKHLQNYQERDPLELQADVLLQTQKAFGQILQVDYTAQLWENIFRNFCVGK